MTTRVALSIVLFLTFLPNLLAQGSVQQTEKVSLTMVIDDFRYIRTEFDDIEIQAREVDALIGIRQSMDKILQSPILLEKKGYETLSIDIIKSMANNMLIFMDRMIISGRDAERFQRFRDSLRKALED